MFLLGFMRFYEIIWDYYYELKEKWNILSICVVVIVHFIIYVQRKQNLILVFQKAFQWRIASGLVYWQLCPIFIVCNIMNALYFNCIAAICWRILNGRLLKGVERKREWKKITKITQTDISKSVSSKASTPLIVCSLLTCVESFSVCFIIWTVCSLRLVCCWFK